MTILTYFNLTPHPVRIIDHDDVVTDYPPSGTVARITEDPTDEPSPDGHRRVAIRLGTLDGLPDPHPGVVFIVSMPCAMALAASGSDRTDVVYPYRYRRDSQGAIVGAFMLARIEPLAVPAR